MENDELMIEPLCTVRFPMDGVDGKIFLENKRFFSLHLLEEKLCQPQ
ncbi:hypothetical protein BSM4216_1185 [Bacillus smithii]|nr:hypothetical protein BSM4216_1185 [Bacillus smithii]